MTEERHEIRIAPHAKDTQKKNLNWQSGVDKSAPKHHPMLERWLGPGRWYWHDRPSQA
jgi:hypothetical protein